MPARRVAITSARVSASLVGTILLSEPLVLAASVLRKKHLLIPRPLNPQALSYHLSPTSATEAPWALWRHLMPSPCGLPHRDYHTKIAPSDKEPFLGVVSPLTLLVAEVQQSSSVRAMVDSPRSAWAIWERVLR